MNDDGFLEQVQRAFQRELAEGSLRLTSHTYRPEAFGNATAVLEAPELRLMISKDRSLYYAYVAHPKSPLRWTFLQMAIPAAAGRSKPDYYHPHGNELDIASAAELFRSHRETLAAAYKKNGWAFSRRLKKISREYQDRMIEWHASPEGKKAYADILARIEAVRAGVPPEKR